MPQTYYMAADGGGTKLLTVLYDDDLRVVRTGRVAGVNTLFKPVEDVEANIHAMMTELLQDLDGEIVAADICMVGSRDIMAETIHQFCPNCRIYHQSEPVVGLAASLKTTGVLALSGTGSDAFFVKDGVTQSAVGGWGPLLGDEGSGYEIGLNAIKAAIYSYDGRKEKSMLYDLVMERWNLDNLWGIVTHLAGNPDARHEVASAAKLCSKAAHAGDATALRIYERAALDVSLQTRTVIEQNREEWDGTVVITGGAWKGHPRMFEVFQKEIRLIYPEANVSLPIFEPVVGCVVLRCIREGHSPEEVYAALAEGFAKFIYQ